MTDEFDLDVAEDPEVLEYDDVDGGEENYDGAAVKTIPFDPTQFELPDDFEVEEDEDE